jgi:hypothetical protein
MYASEAEFHTLAGKDVNSEVTISGTVRRVSILQLYISNTTHF